MSVLEFIPLTVFFIVYKLYNLIHATAALLIASVAVVILNSLIRKKMPSKLILISTSFLILMGGLTLVFQDATFIQMKPSAFYAITAVIIGAGLFFDRLFVKQVFDKILDLNHKQWRVFSVQWMFFFISASCMNEVTWRFLGENSWLWFKTLFMPLFIVLYALGQLFYYRKHLRTKSTERR